MALRAYVVQTSRPVTERAPSIAGPTWDRIAARIDALDRALWERATRLATEAGLDVGRNVWHNAMLAYEAGQPWIDVDYPTLRRAIRVDGQRSDVWSLRSRLWRAYERRHYPERGIG